MEFCCRYFYIPDAGTRACSLPSAPQAPPRTAPAVGPEYSNSNIYDNAVGRGGSAAESHVDYGASTHSGGVWSTPPLPLPERGTLPPPAAAQTNDQAAKKGGFRNLFTHTVGSHVSRHSAKARNPDTHPLPSVPVYMDILPTPAETRIPSCRYMESPGRQVPPPALQRGMTSPSALLPAPTPDPLLPANCNIVLFNISRLVDVLGEPASESPVFCQFCTAALSRRIRVEDQEVWRCDFCGASIPLDSRWTGQGLGEDQLYLGAPNPAGDPHSLEDSLLVFCIDTSGSMCVTSKLMDDQNHEALYTTRMQAVKFGLLNCLTFLKERHPKQRVALVTFSDQVVMHGDGTQPPQKLQDLELLDQDYLRSQGHNQPRPQRLAESLAYLEAAIQRLKERGATALGPAALVSIAMASQKPGSKVIICTDGKANTDLGNLEDITEDIVRQSSKLYYSNLAGLALQSSVMVSVLTIEGTDCSLLELGQLASKTGGKVNIVPPGKLSSEFQSILEDEVIATNVRLKLFLPSSMFFLYEEHTLPILEYPIGSASKDTGVTFEFRTHESKYQETLRHSELPFQAQLSFTRPDGQSAVRILSQNRPVTNDSSAAEDTIDVGVLQMHSAQLTARLAMDGRVEEARCLALAQKELIERVLRTHKDGGKDAEYEEWESSMSPIYEDLQAYREQDPSSSRNSQDRMLTSAGSKTLSDEMASMMFRLKHAKQKVLKKLKPISAD